MKSAKAINSLTSEKQGYKQNQRKLPVFVVVLSDRVYMFLFNLMVTYNMSKISDSVGSS